MNNSVKVSIICNTYNHEKYIEDALNGFLKQKVNFNYEILIHDDASSDNTKSIIREFQIRYPNIVKPILQTENQYSKGVDILSTYQYPRVRGEYIAFCEGDDFWIDDYKLQKQVDFLDNHQNVDICSHAAFKVIANTKKIIGTISPSKSSTIFKVEDVILGGGGFVATNSLVYRTELIKEMPRFRRFMNLDYALQINGSLKGGMGYLSDVMSAYRIESNGSWTSTMKKNPAILIEHIHKVNKMLQMLDEDTSFKYSKAIKAHIVSNEVEILKLKKNYKLIFSNLYRDYRKGLPKKDYIKLLIKYLLFS